MATLTPASAGAPGAQAGRPTCGHTTIRLTTSHPTEFIDQTHVLERFVAEAAIRYGLLSLQTLHTTTGIVVNEHEPLLLSDFQALLEATAPRDGRYRHDDMTARTVNVVEAERPNGHAHCRALFLPPSACLNIAGGRLVLGRWQRVFFVELDGPRDRELSVLVSGWMWP